MEFGGYMKIATLTFHRAINFGAVMQTYALQKTLKKFNVKTEVIDYRSSFLENVHNPHYFKKYLNIKSDISRILKNNFFRDNRKNFYQFINENIELSDEVYSSAKDLKKCNNLYDKIIVGSDQVWNYKCTNFDRAYFLDFVENNKKYSYAASLGLKEIPSDYQEDYNTLLKQFNNISVRENDAKELLKKQFNISSEVVLDPTFLLEKTDLDELCEKRKGLEKKFVFVYLIGKSKSAFEYAKAIAKEKDLEVVFLNEYMFPVRGVKNIFYVKPKEWVWLIKNAEYVVTNSFHGMAFSIKFNKNFMMDTGIKNKDYTRIFNILNLLDIKNRVIQNKNIPEKIDYSKVNKKLSKEIASSLEFIAKIIKE